MVHVGRRGHDEQGILRAQRAQALEHGAGLGGVGGSGDEGQWHGPHRVARGGDGIAADPAQCAFLRASNLDWTNVGGPITPQVVRLAVVTPIEGTERPSAHGGHHAAPLPAQRPHRRGPRACRRCRRCGLQCGPVRDLDARVRCRQPRDRGRRARGAPARAAQPLRRADRRPLPGHRDAVAVADRPAAPADRRRSRRRRAGAGRAAALGSPTRPARRGRPRRRPLPSAARRPLRPRAAWRPRGPTARRTRRATCRPRSASAPAGSGRSGRSGP